MTFIVTKQIHWPDGERMVEISLGGFDYVNPGCCSNFHSFDFALEAANFALEMAKEWGEKVQEEISVGYGYTHGCCMPFEPSDQDELLQWAKEQDDALPCCDRCGKKIPNSDKEYRLIDDPFEQVFCSQFCAEETFLEQYEQ